MSQNEKLINEIIEYIESSIHENLVEADFIKNFRKRIESYLEERLK